MPKVSIQLLTKNRSVLLRDALTSIIGQTFSDYELIVVNDGSTDDTKQVIEGYRNSYSNIAMLNHERSFGIVQSRQEALLASSGEYIAILDDDDIWTDRDKLAKQVHYLDEHMDFVLVGGGIEMVPADGSAGYGQRRRVFRPESDQAIRRTMLFRNNFLTSSVMFRREAALAAGGFTSDGDDFAEDYDLWLRLGLRGRFYNFPEVFVRYRQSLYTKGRFQSFLCKQLRLIQSYSGHYPWLWLANAFLRARLYLNF